VISIQKLSVSNVNSDILQVEITIADAPDPEDATTYLIAALPVKRRGHSLESIEAATIEGLMHLLRQAIPSEVKQRMKAVY
jgi:hypothetical protein